VLPTFLERDDVVGVPAHGRRGGRNAERIADRAKVAVVEEGRRSAQRHPPISETTEPFHDAPLQFVVSAGQLARHLPPEHTPPPHDIPQVPQFAMSTATVVHAPPHIIWPAVHDWPSTLP